MGCLWHLTHLAQVSEVTYCGNFSSVDVPTDWVRGVKYAHVPLACTASGYFRNPRYQGSASKASRT